MIVQTGSDRRTIHRGGLFGRYAPSGHLLYVNGGKLFAAPFDAGRLEITAAAVPVVDDIAHSLINGAAQYSLSNTGMLAYRRARSPNRLLQWMDPSGQVQPLRSVRAEYQEAVRTAEANEELATSGIISRLELSRSRDRREELATRLRLAEERLAVLTEAAEAQLRVQQAQVERLQAISDFQRERMEAMRVRAGIDGVVQEVPFDPGQWANPGQTLARVVQPGQLKAVLRIPEVQARDVAIGQPARIDTRNGMGAALLLEEPGEERERVLAQRRHHAHGRGHVLVELVDVQAQELVGDQLHRRALDAQQVRRLALVPCRVQHP